MGTLKLQIYASPKAAGEAAALAAVETLRQLEKTASEITVIFATGASQLQTLHALTSMPGLP